MHETARGKLYRRQIASTFSPHVLLPRESPLLARRESVVRGPRASTFIPVYLLNAIRPARVATRASISIRRLRHRTKCNFAVAAHERAGIYWMSSAEAVFIPLIAESFWLPRALRTLPAPRSRRRWSSSREREHVPLECVHRVYRRRE